ncbi:uncharacterized protein LY89DRAFT_385378 [Mollisia scopiformis]|uniref:Uncharacterized protein n=1 Tax=Mollisia scopiformis TaxID=149040 RepID=A0A194XP28_MOLSC|nr:uncharacterized protein LY89DRAFT_385378 [Mollisia scopiformis]KUJ21834.1 hypothetical protein LY89DRAFT_385378 [Mollisia scopiformis]
MSNRNKNQKKAPAETPAGLTKALEGLGRIRGSAATPQPTMQPSMQPSGGMTFKDRDAMAKGEGQQNHPQEGGSSSSDTSGGGVTLTMAPHKPPTILEVASNFQERLNTLIAQVQQTKLSQTVKKELTEEIKSIAKEFRDHFVRIQQEIKLLKDDKQHYQRQLVDTARRLDGDLEASRKDIEKLRLEIKELREQAKQAEDNLENANLRFKEETDHLNARLQMQDEQIKGKRALWLESNSASGARRSAMTPVRNPFESPSAQSSFNKGFGQGMMGHTRSPSTTTSPYNSFGSGIGNLPSPSPASTSFGSNVAWDASPPKMRLPDGSASRRAPGLPYLKALPAAESPSGIISNSAARRIVTEAGDVPINPNYGALVLFNENADEDLSPVFEADITVILLAIEGWVKEYAHVPNHGAIQNIMMNNKDLWDYMLNCTYPGNRQDAYNHTMALVNDRGCRYWFVMRMIAHYVFTEMLSIEAWHGFGNNLDKILKDVAKQLADKKGLLNDKRQHLVDRRTTAVQTIVNDPMYKEWRSKQLHDHSRRLRNMLGPMLNIDSDRTDAGRDLGTLAIQVWDLSAKMHTTPLTFQIYFPETGTKFVAAHMIAKDRPNIDPVSIQVNQPRIKLVITPVVTLRDDHGSKIKAKNLHHAAVLLMG